MSDIHVDFYSVQTKFYDTVEPDFEDVYKRYFKPADALILARRCSKRFYYTTSLLSVSWH